MKFNIVELFAGVAGLSQGFLRTGRFNLLALIDNDKLAVEVFKANFPDHLYIKRDIRNLAPARLRERLEGASINGLLGGPPCQGFSPAGRKNPHDARNNLVRSYKRFVDFLQPDFIVLENVPEIVYHEVFKKLVKDLEKTYKVEICILNSALYGVPQTRHRAFILAYRADINVAPRFPNPSHGFNGKEYFNYYKRKMQKTKGDISDFELLGAAKSITLSPYLNQELSRYKKTAGFVTVEDAIGDLTGLSSGETSTEYLNIASTEYQRQMRSDNGCLANHTARDHNKSTFQLIKKMPEGGDLRDMPKEYWPKSHYSQAYGRLHRRGLARTITTCFHNLGSGRFIHPTDNRTITVREAARLQGFSDEFHFEGTLQEQMKHVGNAVPLHVAQAIANQIWKDLHHIIDV